MAKARAVSVKPDADLLATLEAMPPKRTGKQCYICAMPPGVVEAIRIAVERGVVSVPNMAEALRARGYEHTTRSKIDYHKRSCIRR